MPALDERCRVISLKLKYTVHVPVLAGAAAAAAAAAICVDIPKQAEPLNMQTTLVALQVAAG